MVKVAPKEDDKIPLLEYDDGSRPVERRRHRPEMTTNVDVTHPVQPETVAHLVQPDDTLEAISLRYGCTKAELKQINSIFNDADIIAKKVLLVPVRKLLSNATVPTDMLINIDPVELTKDSDESNSMGDAETATNALFDRIDKSNEEAFHKVSSIGNRHAPNTAEVRRDCDKRLNEFLGNLPPVAVLPDIGQLQREAEHRQWCYLGFCILVILVVVPVVLYYYLGVLHRQFVIP